MNWAIIAENLDDARHDIEIVLANLGGPEMTLGRFKFHVENILHHVLTAWNARHVTDKRYEQMSDEDFFSWSRMYNDLVPLGAHPDRKPPALPRPGKFDRGWGKRYLARHWTKSERKFTWEMRRKKKKP